jgi:3-hydroxybutyryl-CoA dehydrogenase
MPDVNTVAVLGCGLMGSGIAEVSAKAGFATIVREIDDAALARGKAAIQRSLDRAVERGKLEADARSAITDGIRYTTSLDDLADADIVIEAAPEDIEIKNQLFRALDTICAEHTIFASNTSSMGW